MPAVDLIAVQMKDPFRMLVAVILSARTMDETTAKASAGLLNSGACIGIHNHYFKKILLFFRNAHELFC